MKNHAKFDPAFHFFLAPLALLMFFEAIWRMIHNHDFYTAMHLVAVIWGVVALFKMRLYSLKVQDRVIRLEERVRLKELAPAGLQGRIGELTVDQLIGLRFASDGEVAGLAQQALDGHWSRKQIKEAVKMWRPDNWRV